MNDEVQLVSAKRVHADVESVKQIRELQKEIEFDLENLRDYQTEIHGPLTITYRLHDNIPSDSLCGSIRVRLDRTCFVRINPDIQTQMHYEDEEAKFNYLILRKAFDFLESWRSVVLSSEMKSRLQLARSQSRDLGFPLFENDTDIYLPCRFSLFQQLFTLDNKFLPLQKRGAFVIVDYHIKCPELDPMELINMALERDVGKMKAAILGVDDTRYMKLENVVMEDTKEVRLSCRLTRSIDCRYNMKPVLWRSTAGQTFGRRTMLNERIYMSGTCELVIQAVERNDSGIYQCFIRDPHNPAVWHRTPKLAYRLRVEKANYKLPDWNDMLIGLFVLTGWSICILVLWIILLIFNQQVHLNAMAVAKARQNRNREMAGIATDFPVDTESPV
ncbi:unnamed protein product [Echinostoma caproni]|uniref:Ig-like domain-containing protein n=1 Tax=Echinostoma caproni TaxID=27848 RepID=A0A183AXM8_9TREM|nr:unnamed protein product [Echinostoma caproni]